MMKRMVLAGVTGRAGAALAPGLAASIGLASALDPVMEGL